MKSLRDGVVVLVVVVAAAAVVADPSELVVFVLFFVVCVRCCFCGKISFSARLWNESRDNDAIDLLGDTEEIALETFVVVVVVVVWRPLLGNKQTTNRNNDVGKKNRESVAVGSSCLFHKKYTICTFLGFSKARLHKGSIGACLSTDRVFA